MSKHISNHMPGHMSKHMPGHMSKHMFGHMSEHMPDRMSNHVQTGQELGPASDAEGVLYIVRRSAQHREMALRSGKFVTPEYYYMDGKDARQMHKAPPSPAITI